MGGIEGLRAIGCYTVVLHHAPSHGSSSHSRSRDRLLTIRLVGCLAGTPGLALRLLTELAERLASSTTSIRSEQAAPPIRVSLHVQTSNTAAISLYKNVGFVASKHKKIGHYRGTRYGGADAWEMTKEL